MSIKKTIITTIVALTLVAMVAPGVAQGLTTAELIQQYLGQIAILQQQLLALQGGTTPTPSGTVPADCVGITLSRTLIKGSTGSDVKCVQALLNTDAATQVAVSGVGSAGNETTYYGNLSVVAVKKFQGIYGTGSLGTVGPKTMAKMNSMLAGGTPGTPATPGTPVVPTGAGLTVQLAYNNPASGTVIPLQALAPLAKFTFVNGDNAEVKITNLKVNRVGLSLDSTLSNIYLLNGAVRLTDAASVSSGVITFNDPTGLFTVPAGGSTTITVASDLAATAGQTLGVAINAAANVITNASSVKGVFPVSGNLMSVATATGAGIAIGATTSSPSANTSLIPQNDYVVWQSSIVVSTRAVDMTRLALREIGTINKTDLQNFRLFVDGTQVGSAVANLDANGYVTFDLSAAPKRLETGTRVTKVMADIIGGSSRTFQFSLRVAADANFVDTQYNVNTYPGTTASTTTFTTSEVTSGLQTIASGTLIITKKTDSPSGDVVNGANNAVLARYALTAAGESVKIETLTVRALFTNTVSSTDDYAGTSTAATAAEFKLRNGAIYANGVQIGNTTSITPVAAGTAFNLGSSLIVVPGSPVTLEVRGDIYDDTGTYNDVDATDIIQAQIVVGASNAYGMVSSSTISTPSAIVSGNSLTVAIGGLTLSKYTAYTDQNAVLPVAGYKLGHFTLTANTTEAVNINTIEVGLNYVSAYTSSLYVKLGDYTTSTKPTGALSNSWSVSHSLAVGETVDVMVYGDVSSTHAGTAITGMYIAGTTASSATSVAKGTTPQVGGSTIVGQTITFTTGTPTTAVDGSTPLDQAVAGGQSVVAGKFKLTAQNDSYTIKELEFTVAGDAATSAVIQSLTVKDGSTALVTVPYDSVNTKFDIAGLSVLVAANTTKVLTVEYNLATPYTDGTTITTGKAATLTMSQMKVANSQGTESTPTTARAANYTYVYKTVPTFTNIPVTAQGVKLVSGAATELIKFTVAADAKGPVALKQLRFNTDITDDGTASAPTMNTFSFFRGSTNITTSVAIIDAGGTSLEATATSINENNSSDVYVVFDTEEVIPAGTTYTYTLKGTPSGFIGASGNADSIATSISQDTTPAGVAAGANATKFYLDATATTGKVQTLNTSAAGAGTGTGAWVIWSDNSAQLHDYTYNGSSTDWWNGYLIDSMPLPGSALNYNN